MTSGRDGYYRIHDGYYRIPKFYALYDIHKQKVRTQEKREITGGRVDNNHISLKSRQIARIRLGKKERKEKKKERLYSHV